MNDILAARLVKKGRWGYFGGAFDPPHLGHLILATELASLAGLEGVLVAPTFYPPHKSQSVASFADRLEMTSRAFSPDSRFVVTDIENTLPPPSYTITLVETLCKRCPNIEWSVLVGSDNLAILPAWRDIDRLRSLATIVVGSRPSDGPSTQCAPSGIAVYETTRIDISSTRLRQWRKKGCDLRHYVPDSVREYIVDRKLYL